MGCTEGEGKEHAKNNDQVRGLVNSTTTGWKRCRRNEAGAMADRRKIEKKMYAEKNQGPKKTGVTGGYGRKEA